MATAIKKCTCSNKFQDKRYGSGMRVMNSGGTKENVTYKCTVCGSLAKMEFKK